MAVFSVISFFSLASARADTIPYPNDGTENINLYTFTATSDSTIGGYFYNETSGYTNTLSLLVNGVVTPETAAGVLNNHASSMGDFVNLGTVHAGDVLTFRLNVVTTGDSLFSDRSLNADGINYVYSTAFSGDAVHGIPAGTYVGFEDLRGGGDFDYDDETFVFTNVAAIPEPETYAMLLAGLGVIGWMVRRSE
ncbi:MAG: PEP-CTERM sorting domain-containing protein [Nitrosomonadaceae bacterium]|nr:PEP-CTERM sorting domain-containing protein [Nitrosomonadaceae bacterium]